MEWDLGEAGGANLRCWHPKNCVPPNPPKFGRDRGMELLGANIHWDIVSWGSISARIEHFLVFPHLQLCHANSRDPRHAGCSLMTLLHAHLLYLLHLQNLLDKTAPQKPATRKPIAKETLRRQPAKKRWKITKLQHSFKRRVLTIAFHISMISSLVALMTIYLTFLPRIESLSSKLVMLLLSSTLLAISRSCATSNRFLPTSTAASPMMTWSWGTWVSRKKLTPGVIRPTKLLQIQNVAWDYEAVVTANHNRAKRETLTVDIWDSLTWNKTNELMEEGCKKFQQDVALTCFLKAICTPKQGKPNTARKKMTSRSNYRVVLLSLLNLLHLRHVYVSINVLKSSKWSKGEYTQGLVVKRCSLLRWIFKMELTEFLDSTFAYLLINKKVLTVLSWAWGAPVYYSDQASYIPAPYTKESKNRVGESSFLHTLQ